MSFTLRKSNFEPGAVEIVGDKSFDYKNIFKLGGAEWDPDNKKWIFRAEYASVAKQIVDFLENIRQQVENIDKNNNENEIMNHNNNNGNNNINNNQIQPPRNNVNKNTDLDLGKNIVLIDKFNKEKCVSWLLQNCKISQKLSPSLLVSNYQTVERDQEQIISTCRNKLMKKTLPELQEMISNYVNDFVNIYTNHLMAQLVFQHKEQFYGSSTPINHFSGLHIREISFPVKIINYNVETNQITVLALQNFNASQFYDSPSTVYLKDNEYTFDGTVTSVDYPTVGRYGHKQEGKRPRLNLHENIVFEKTINEDTKTTITITLYPINYVPITDEKRILDTYSCD